MLLEPIIKKDCANAMAAKELSWARSLYHTELKDNTQPCSWSEELGVFIHRFSMTSRTCNCSKETVVKKETSGGWKRISNDKLESENSK